MFLFGYALVQSNIWTAANTIGANGDHDHDLTEDGKYWKAVVFFRHTIDDVEPLEIGEVGAEKLSEISKIVRYDFFLIYIYIYIRILAGTLNSSTSQ